MRVRVADGLVVVVKLVLGAVWVERRGPVVRDLLIGQPLWEESVEQVTVE